MLSGSTALGVYATPRMTRDLDLVVQLDAGNVDTFVHAFSEDFYCDADAVRRSTLSRGIVNLIHTEHIVKVDIIVRKDTPYRRLEFERRRPVTIDGREMWVVSPEDLILSKLDWVKQGGSPIQMADVRELVSSVTDLDWGYLDQWAGELTVTTLLADARRA